MAKKNKVQKHTRRANGDGSIFQRKDGLWCGYITLGYDDNGKQKKRYVYGGSRAEVSAKLTELSGRIKNTAYQEIENKTISELMLEWLLTFKKVVLHQELLKALLEISDCTLNQLLVI